MSYPTDFYSENIKTRKVKLVDTGILSVFSGEKVANITVDSGATGNFIKESTARELGLKIEKSDQKAVQADGETPLNVVGEVHVVFSRGKSKFQFDGLVVNNLDDDILGGAPFQKTNAIMSDFVNEIFIINQPSLKCTFPFTRKQTAVSGALTRLIKIQEDLTVEPNDYITVKLDQNLNRDQSYIVEPRLENKINWPPTQKVNAVGHKIKIKNENEDLLYIPKDSLIQVRQMIDLDPIKLHKTVPDCVREVKNTLEYKCEVEKVVIDEGKQLSKEGTERARALITKHQSVFGNDIPGYNGAKGKFEASFEFSSHERPIIGRSQVPVYNKKHADIFQQKCDIEHARGRIQTLSELGEQPALINNAFLVLKQSAAADGKTLQDCDVNDVRLVCSFDELKKFIKKMPAKVTTESEIWAKTARFKLMGETDLTDAFSQMNMKQEKRKYLCFLTPHKGIMCYSSGPQGLLGMSEYLDNLTDIVFGDLIMNNVCLKIHDQLFVGGHDEKSLLENWDKVLSRLGQCDLRLKPAKTTIAIQKAVIYGKIWEKGNLKPSPHKITPLSYINRPLTVGALRSFLGGVKIHAECLKGIGHFQAKLTPLASNEKKSTDEIIWTEETSHAFNEIQKILKDPQTITIPRPEDQKYIISDAATKCPAFGAILLVKRKDDKTGKEELKIGGYYNMKLKEGLLPCEAEAIGIERASAHWDHYSRESEEPTIILTDSDPCVRSYRRMSKGKFSTSSKLQNFLHKLSGRFVQLHHVSAKMYSNLINAADFQSRHYNPCTEEQRKKCPFCQFCQEDDTLLFARSIDLLDTIEDPAKIPFQSKQGWKSIQGQCKDLKRAVAYLKTNTRPGIRDTKIRDVKRYLQQDLVVDGDGLIMARKPFELEPKPRNLIVIPRAFSRSFIRLLHNETNHPKAAQTFAKFNKKFYALDAKAIIDDITKDCDLCCSTTIIPKYLPKYSTTVKPVKPGTHAAADILMRENQKIMVFREILTSHTSTTFLENQNNESLRTALIKLALFYKTEDWIVIRIDNAPGFLPLKTDPVLEEYKIKLDFGDEKNPNHNPVAEKAIRELEDEIVKLMPRGGKLSEIVLAKATEVLNKIIRHSGYNSQELLTNRDQSTGAKLDLSDVKLSDLQWKMRVENHSSSAKHHSRDAKPPDKIKVQPGDIALIKSEKSKHKAREKYFVVNVMDDDYVEVQKITENQIRAKKYRVKIEELMILNRFKEEESETKNSDEKYFSAEEDLNRRDLRKEDLIKSENSKNKSKPKPKRLKSKKQCTESTCKFCMENNLQAIHHDENYCWRKKNLFKKTVSNVSFEDDSETSDEDFEPYRNNDLGSNSEDSSGEPRSESSVDNIKSETDEEGDGIEEETNFNNLFLQNENSTPQSTARSEERLPPRPPRSAPVTQAPPRPSRDIPGRLVTRGDLIKYFSGYIDAESQEEIWLTAVVTQMQVSEQRKHPNHYNVAGEEGSNFSLELLPGEKWAVRRNNRWETF